MMIFSWKERYSNIPNWKKKLFVNKPDTSSQLFPVTFPIMNKTRRFTIDFYTSYKKERRRRREDFLYCFYISGAAAAMRHYWALPYLPHHTTSSCRFKPLRCGTLAANRGAPQSSHRALIMSCHRSSGSLRNWNIDYAKLWSYLVVWERWLRGENVPLLSSNRKASKSQPTLPPSCCTLYQ